MSKRIHPIAGAVAFFTIAVFWTSTAFSELFGSKEMIAAVKSAIPWGFLVLIPAIAASGGTGFALAKGGRVGLVGTKMKRMPFIAANGLLVLIPCAFYLASKASSGAFDAGFYVVQALELTAGATNLTLLGLNMRDGLRMTGKLGSGRGSSFEVALVGRETVADGTMAFHFTRPGGFTYEAGQHVTLKLINPAETDAAGSSRAFTLASAPHEAELTVATRLRDTAFKRTLKGLPIGGKISLTGPRGDMTLHADPARPAVFLAGGIGITPFLSMARHAAHAKLPHKIVLIYSNRRPEDAAFLAELQQLAKTNENFKLVATMTTVREAAQAWDGETSVINEELLRRSLPDVLSPIYYFAGPGPMVGAMQDMLRKIGVAQQDMVFEQFYGY
jgi:ferredoxin-NADP reductase